MSCEIPEALDSKWKSRIDFACEKFKDETVEFWIRWWDKELLRQKNEWDKFFRGKND